MSSVPAWGKGLNLAAGLPLYAWPGHFLQTTNDKADLVRFALFEVEVLRRSDSVTTPGISGHAAPQTVQYDILGKIWLEPSVVDARLATLRGRTTP